MRKIAISDIHGCFQTFKYMIEHQLHLTSDDELFLLGDFIDRGPASKEVIDYIILLQHKGFQLTCLMGNHEDMFLRSATEFTMRDIWERNGGLATKESFGIRSVDDLDSVYVSFFQDLKTYHIDEDYLFVHAGLNFKKRNPLSDQEALLWSRHWESRINYGWLGNRKIIYGHTPHAKHDISDRLSLLAQEQHICIDAGCVFDHLPGLGHLCAFDITNQVLYFSANRD